MSVSRGEKTLYILQRLFPEAQRPALGTGAGQESEMPFAVSNRMCPRKLCEGTPVPAVQFCFLEQKR